MTPLPVRAYADRLSVRPGDTVAFMASVEGADSVSVRFERLIHGDDNPAGPGFKAMPMPTAADGRYPARAQKIRSGSCVLAPAPSEALPRGLTVAVLARPMLLDGREQALIAQGVPESGAGFRLSIGADGALAWAVAGTRLTAGRTLLRGAWYAVTATVGGDGRLALRQVPLHPSPHVDPANEVSAPGAGAPRLAAGAPLLMAACEGMDGERRLFFNGRLERPVLLARPPASAERAALDTPTPLPDPADPDVLGAWDFAAGPAGTQVVDRSSHRRHGTTVNLPTRAVAGAAWRGDEMCFARAPDQYAAIHFHEDDLYDAGWDPDVRLQVPEDWPSGVYAAHLATASGEDRVPFMVRARPGGEAEAVLLLPTASYMAYANDHCHLEGANPQMLAGRLLELTAADLFLAAHPEYGLSLYDRHRDGSGCCHSSRLRPILNMRPKHAWWLGGPGSATWQLNADLAIVDWLDAQGIACDVLTDEDLHHEGAAALAPYRVVLTGTHPEYTSTAMHDALQGHLEAGGRLMYLGGNGFYWRIAFHPALPGVIELRRAEDGTRSWAAEPGEYYMAFTGEYGGLWRRNGRPPQGLVGVGFAAQGFGASTWFRRTEASRDLRAAFIFDGVDAEVIGDFGLNGGGAAGLELDRADADLGTPPHALVVARSAGHGDLFLLANEEIGVNRPNVTGSFSPLVRADMVFFETAAGGAVFSTGSIAWCGSLSHAGYDNTVSRMTGNVLRRFLDPEPFEAPVVTGDGPAPGGG